MHNTKVILALLSTAIIAVRSQSIDQDDVPPECRSICQPLISLENQCDNQFDDDDDDSVQGSANSNQQYRDCVCNGQGAVQALQDCQQCTSGYPQYFIDNDDDDNDNENEVEEWIRICGVQAGPGQTPAPNNTATPTQTATQSQTTQLVTYPCNDDNDDTDDTDDTDDNDDICTSTIVAPVGAPIPGPNTTPAPAPAPGTTPTGSVSTATITYACPDNDDTDDTDDNDDNDDQDTCTATTVVPIGATISTPVVSLSITTDGAGTTIRTSVTSYTGGAPIATAMPFIGAGAAIVLAGMAL